MWLTLTIGVIVCAVLAIIIECAIRGYRRNKPEYINREYDDATLDTAIIALAIKELERKKYNKLKTRGRHGKRNRNRYTKRGKA